MGSAGFFSPAGLAFLKISVLGCGARSGFRSAGGLALRNTSVPGCTAGFLSTAGLALRYTSVLDGVAGFFSAALANTSGIGSAIGSAKLGFLNTSVPDATERS